MHASIRSASRAVYEAVVEPGIGAAVGYNAGSARWRAQQSESALRTLLRYP